MTVQLNFRFNQRARNLVCADNNTNLTVINAFWSTHSAVQLQLFLENFKLAEGRERVTGQLFECSRPGVENV